MTFHRPSPARAFSLIEVLVVIAIIVVVAGLVVGLSTAATDRKNISRAQAERDRLVMWIESYKAKLGLYPPDNPLSPTRHTLLYELAGATRNPPPADPVYNTIFGNVTSNNLYSAFGLTGVVNASDDPTEIKRVLKDIKPDLLASLAPNTLSLVVPIDGPGGRPNPWHYLRGGKERAGTNTLHNPESFDLWVEIKVRGQTRIIGNWKD